MVSERNGLTSGANGGEEGERRVAGEVKVVNSVVLEHF